MLADPQSITIAAATTSLPRTGIAPTAVDYTSADGTLSMRVQQSVNRTTRRTSVSLKVSKIAVDPLTAVNQRVSSAISVSIVTPIDGFTVNELRDQLVGIANKLTASSGAMALQVLAGEK